MRLRDFTPCGHWQTQTIVAALRGDGLQAPAVFDGPLDNPAFLAYVEQVLVPTLRPGERRARQPHPPQAARRPSRDRARRRPPPFLPPYSPDFNPIEMAFAKLKAWLRAARPRTFDQVVELVKQALPLLPRPNVGASSDIAAIASLRRCEKRSSGVNHHQSPTQGD